METLQTSARNAPRKLRAVLEKQQMRGGPVVIDLAAFDQNRRLTKVARSMAERLSTAVDQRSFEAKVTYEIYDDDDLDRFLGEGGMSWALEMALGSGQFRPWVVASVVAYKVLTQVGGPSSPGRDAGGSDEEWTTPDLLDSLPPSARRAVHESYVALLCVITLSMQPRLASEVQTMLMRRVVSASREFLRWVVAVKHGCKINIEQSLQHELDEIKVEPINLDEDYERWETEKSLVAEYCRRNTPAAR